MNATCFQAHPAYLKKWRDGTTICILCAAKKDIAQEFKTILLREKLQLGYNCVCDNTMKLHKPKCPKCGRSQILYRVKTDTFLCRLCGHKWERKEEDK